jgi:NitT/TauT family transport system substrate-binding protein
MIRAEFEELMQLSIEAGTLSHPIPYESYTNERFARNAEPAAIQL